MVILNLTDAQWRACRLMYGMESTGGAAWRFYDAAMYDDVRDALARAAHLNAIADPTSDVGGWYVVQQGVGR